MASDNVSVTVAQIGNAGTARQEERRVGTALVAAVERAAPWLLAAGIGLYVAVIFGVSNWQLHALRFGFDPVIYEQPLWNTLHGHIMEQSGFAYTKSELGHDLILFHFVWLPLYAIKPATTTLLFLQTLATGAGAIAVYLIARDAIARGRVPALLFGLLYLGYVPLQNVNLYEISPRLFATTFLLFAYWCMARGYSVAFWAMLVLAIINRSDTALVVVALGIHGVLTRRTRVFGWLPIVFGALYWIGAMFVIVPAFAGGTQYGYLQNYSWLGDSAGAIARTLLTHPWFVAHHLLTADRVRYLLSLFYPLAFLPLLQPRALLLAVPPITLNLLAGPEFAYQRDIYHQYAALAIPGLFIATILAVAAISGGTHPIVKRMTRVRAMLTQRRSPLAPAALIAGMLALCAAQQLTIHPNRIGQAVSHRHDARIANRTADLSVVVRLIPDDAPLAVTNLAAARVPMRRYIYYFPGDRYYDPALISRAEYVLGDRTQDNGTEAALLDRLAVNGQWEIAGERGDFEVLHRIAPAP